MHEFTGKATVYDKARPGYAPAALEFMLGLIAAAPPASCGGTPLASEGGFKSVIADIGAGTGKFIAMLAERGCDVIAVEPNADMRSKLPALDNLRIIDGTAEATGLPDSSVDAVTCAQAFHWFDGEKFKQECQRILKPGGRVFVVYNNPGPGHERHDELNWCNPGGGACGRPEREERLQTFFGGAMTRTVFPNPVLYDAEGWQAYMLSHSCSPRPGDEDYARFIESIAAIYERCNMNGKVMLPLETVVYTGA